MYICIYIHVCVYVYIYIHICMFILTQGPIRALVDISWKCSRLGVGPHPRSVASARPENPSFRRTGTTRAPVSYYRPYRFKIIHYVDIVVNMI